MFQRDLNEIWPGDHVSVKWTADLSGHVQKESHFTVAKTEVFFPFSDDSSYSTTFIEDIYGESYDTDNVQVEIHRPAIVPWQLGFVILVSLDLDHPNIFLNKNEREILSGEIKLIPGLEPNRWALLEADPSYEGDGVEDLREIDLEMVTQGRVLAAPFDFFAQELKKAEKVSNTPSAQIKVTQEDWEALPLSDKLLFHLEAASYFGPGNS